MWPGMCRLPQEWVNQITKAWWQCAVNTQRQINERDKQQQQQQWGGASEQRLADISLQLDLLRRTVAEAAERRLLQPAQEPVQGQCVQQGEATVTTLQPQPRCRRCTASLEGHNQSSPLQ